MTILDEPHEFAIHTNDRELPEEKQYCAECMLPRANVRHRGEFTITLTVHGNDRDVLEQEVAGMKEFIHLGEHADLWVESTEVQITARE